MDGTTTTSNNTNDTINTILDRNQRILGDIQNLQNVEKEMYERLQKGDGTGVSLTSQQKENIVNKINEIASLRQSLYSNLNDVYSFYQQNTAQSRDALVEQQFAIDIIEDQMNETKKKMKALQDEKYNKLKLVEINTYYGKRYSSHTKLMQMIVLTIIPVLILAILQSKGILPSAVFAILTSFIIMIGGYNIWWKLVDLSNRDNMDFDEYNWYFDKSKAPALNTDVPTGSTAGDPWEIKRGECIGPNCCGEGSSYDASQNLCVPLGTTTTNTTTESMMNMADINTIFSKYAFSPTISQPIGRFNLNVKPYSNNFGHYVSI